MPRLGSSKDVCLSYLAPLLPRISIRTGTQLVFGRNLDHWFELDRGVNDAYNVLLVYL